MQINPRRAGRRALMFAAAGALGCGLSLGAIAQVKGTLVLGSTNSTSSHYTVSAAMAKAIKAGIPAANISHIETGASVDNVRRLTRNELDLGLIATDTAIQAITGTGPFNGRMVDDLVALYSYDISVLNVAVSQESKVGSLKELAGKKLNPGIRGSGAEQLTRQVFTALGIEPAYQPGTVKDAVEAIQNRQIVGYSKYGPGRGVDSTLRELMVTTPMRLLGFSADDRLHADPERDAGRAGGQCAVGADRLWHAPLADERRHRVRDRQGDLRQPPDADRCLAAPEGLRLQGAGAGQREDRRAAASGRT
jgi:TRAP transporter TAXI family solute receptor